jgi:hypothetical protein
MQQQQFRENESANNTGSHYDSETVREVLIRAVEIEKQTEVEAPLTAAQVEALGTEIGLTPEAVRRALGELRPETRASAVRVDTLPTVSQMASALLPGLIYGALLTTLVSVLTLITPSLPRPSWLGGILLTLITAPLPRPPWFGVILFLCVLVVPSLLSLWMGWRRGNRPLASATGLFLTFFAGVTPLIWIGRGYGMPEIFLICLSMAAGMLLGGIGAMARERWEYDQAVNGR